MLDLEAIELIKQLKGRYFRFLDTRDLDNMETVFTADAKAYFKGGDYEFSLTGWPQLREFYEQSFTPTRFGMHHGHHPEITVKGDQATGLWYLQDIFINLENNTTLRGSAIYEDQYVKQEGDWKIAYTGYQRLFEEVEERGDNIRLTVKPIN